jgi:DNA-binding MarR family transcriptional regulator
VSRQPADEGSSFGGPGGSPGFLLWRATLRWQRGITAALQSLALTHVQFVLLATVWWLTRTGGEQPSQRQVADHASTDVMMTSQVLRALEARGLVVRHGDPANARVRRLAVTAQGAALAQRAITVVEDADRRFFSGVDDRSDLLPILRHLAGWQPDAPAA